MRFGYLSSAVLGMLLVQNPSLAQQPNRVTPQVDETLAPYASTKDSVRLPDGRDLHFVCMGKGATTIILTAGAGNFSGVWSAVQPSLAKLTRVCAWDRPGFGLSDGSAREQTAAATTDDLEVALAAGTIHGPYLMVGQSIGAYETLLFTDRHPNEVIGMVLVDPSPPDHEALALRVSPALWLKDPEQSSLVQLFRKCAAGVRSGAAKPGGPDPDGCFSYPPTWPAALQNALRSRADGNPLLFETVASSLTTQAESGRQVVNPQRNYNDMPLVVLTATVDPYPLDLPPDVRVQAIASAAAMNTAHDEYAALSSRGYNIRVPRGDHNMHQSRPEVVVDAVRMVIDEAKDHPPRTQFR